MNESRLEPGVLTKKVLADVSRSFYLSLRLLPAGMREGTGVAYLLARLSDTLADAGAVLENERVRALAGFRKVMAGKDERSGWLAGLAIFKNDDSLKPGEIRLLARAGDCLAAFDGLPDWQKSAIHEVVETITDGQTWDLTRFRGKGVVALAEDAELLRYCYQVAGCVGEFWTRMAAGQGEKFGGVSEEKMRLLGLKYGEALQLINILRDVPEDLERGRCYLPGVDFSDAQKAKDELLRERTRWIATARQGLCAAHEYCDVLGGKRLRVASRLPAMIGEKTLDLLDEADWDRWKSGVKVSRKTVRREMWRALWA